jgi:hypothetical protein
MAASFMLIMVENKCLDPVKILEPYLINKTELTSNILTDLKKEIPSGDYCIIGHIKNYFLLRFNSKDFIDGITFCCKLLKRDSNNIIIENSLDKKPKDYFVHTGQTGPPKPCSSLSSFNFDPSSIYHSAPPSTLSLTSPSVDDDYLDDPSVRRKSSVL